MENVLNELCYKGTILRMSYRKMTMKLSFSYSFFVKIHGKISWELQHDQITGQPRYVKLAYLEYMAYVEEIIYSPAFPLYCFVFKPVYIELGYHEISAISKSFFIPKN